MSHISSGAAAAHAGAGAVPFVESPGEALAPHPRRSFISRIATAGPFKNSDSLISN